MNHTPTDPSRGDLRGIRLGPFELISPLGMGGMGEVWRGRHTVQDIPVAVKLLTRATRTLPGGLDPFQAEIRAMAGLNHPGIAVVFDCGRLTPEARDHSGGYLPEGSPYLIMEFAGLGTLEAFEGRPLPWTVCRAVALSVLDALAHAHARGVIHRDIKPANILVAGLDDARPGLKLGDFGIAHLLEGEEAAEGERLTMGTPHFMAPEQFDGRWREHGPWTDLYALGCTLWLLAVGSLPYEGQSAVELAFKHLRHPTPVLPDIPGLPEGFGAWLGRMMAKEPSVRFQRAADAAWALSRLAPPPMEVTEAPAALLARLLEDRVDSPSAMVTCLMAAPPAEALGSWTTAASPTTGPTVTMRPVDQVGFSPSTLVNDPLPPMPETWRQPARSSPPGPILGVGTGLFGLRRAPLVGRIEARDMLWEALGDVQREGSARLIVLRGPAGVGKSRLVEWLAQRAHETGVATVLEARHSPIPGAGVGIPGMLARHLRCAGTDRDSVLTHCETQLRKLGEEDPRLWRALAEMIAPGRGDETPFVRFETPVDRHAFVRLYLERISRQRPALVWLDDIQWGDDALDLAGHLMKARMRSPHPILLVLTARDEALFERPVSRWALRELTALDGATRMDIPPLDAEEIGELVGSLLGLETTLAHRIVRRCGGNPLFAIQLVSDWIDRGALRSARHGFVLAPGEDMGLPDSLHEVWRDRVARALRGHSDAARDALEIAAALGDSVSVKEWDLACQIEGLTLPIGLVEDLLAMRLVSSDSDEGWRFIHGMLRESIARNALEEGRWRRHHLACDRMLVRLYPSQPPGIAERRGHHLLEAGVCEDAAGLLYQAAGEHMRVNEFKLARTLLDTHEEALNGAAVPTTDPRWGASWVLKARIHGYLVQLDEANALARRVLDLSERLGWEEVGPQALRSLADIERMQFRLPLAADLYSRALEAFEAQGEPGQIAACLNGMGATAQLRGDFDAATEYLQRAVVLWTELGRTRSLANAFATLGHIHQSRGELDAWEVWCHKALDLFEQCGDHLSLATGYNDLAEIARSRGDLEAAEAGYRRAAELCSLVGYSEDVTQLNLALTLLARGRYRDARTTVEAILPLMARSGRSGFLVYAHAVVLATVPDTGTPTEWDHHCGRLRDLIAVSGIKDPDLTWCAQLAADRARACGMEDRAPQADALA